MAALTLIEAAKRETGNVHRASIIEMFARAHPLLGVMPFENISGNAVSWEQEGTLPTNAFRGVNAAYSTDAGTLNPLTERLTIAGGDLDVDTFIVRTMGADQRAVRERMKVKQLAHTIAHKVIKGDSDTDQREFDGLQARAAGTQLIANGSGTPAALKLTNMDKGIDAVDMPTHILMSKSMRRHFSVVAKTTSLSGTINYTVDQFGMQIMTYNGLPVVEMDGPELVNNTLAYDEASSSTSIYIVSFGDGQLTGIQNGEMDVRDLGELQTQPQFRTRVEWYIGIAPWHDRSFCRISEITDAAIVAGP